jgi:hypothetical protein
MTGNNLCVHVSMIAVLSLVSSILTLTLVSCDRFFGIVFAMKARVTERRSAVLIGVVWASAVAVSLPVLVYRQQLSRRWLDHTEIWCGDEWPAVSFPRLNYSKSVADQRFEELFRGNNWNF